MNTLFNPLFSQQWLAFLKATRVSSAGAFGAYPFWDVQKEYVGLVARQGAIGSFQNGITIERNVRFFAEHWADRDVSR